MPHRASEELAETLDAYTAENRAVNYATSVLLQFGNADSCYFLYIFAMVAPAHQVLCPSL